MINESLTNIDYCIGMSLLGTGSGRKMQKYQFAMSSAVGTRKATVVLSKMAGRRINIFTSPACKEDKLSKRTGTKVEGGLHRKCLESIWNNLP